VRGLCASTPEKLERAQKKTGVEFITTDYHDLLKRSDIHVVALFTPDHLHGRQSIEALEAGKHIVVTKPFTTSLDEAIQAARLADAKHLKVLVGEAWYVHQPGDALFDITPWRLTVPQNFLYGGVCHPRDSLVSFMGEVEDAIVNDRRPAIDAWEGVKTIAAFAACWESIRSGTPVKVQSQF